MRYEYMPTIKYVSKCTGQKALSDIDVGFIRTSFETTPIALTVDNSGQVLTAKV